MRKWLLGLLIAMVLAIVYALSLPDKTIASKEEGVLRIGVANLLFTNTAPDLAARVLANQDIDLLVLLEWTGRNFDEMMLVARGYVKTVCEPHMGTDGICIFHKSGVSLEASIERAPVEGACNMPYASIRLTGDRPIGIQAIHPPPPLQACGNTNQEVLQYHASTIVGGRLSEAVGVLQPDDIAIVMGDFNALAHWPRVRQFSDVGLVDAFSSYRAGLSPTWAPGFSVPDFARIDYFWASPEISQVNAWTLDIPGADHRALVVDIIP